MSESVFSWVLLLPVLFQCLNRVYEQKFIHLYYESNNFAQR